MPRSWFHGFRIYLSINVQNKTIWEIFALLPKRTMLVEMWNANCAAVKTLRVFQMETPDFSADNTLKRTSLHALETFEISRAHIQRCTKMFFKQSACMPEFWDFHNIQNWIWLNSSESESDELCLRQAGDELSISRSVGRIGFDVRAFKTTLNRSSLFNRQLWGFCSS